MSAGKVAPSRILRKFAAYLRQNDLATALCEVGRIKRTLFVIEWILDTSMQRHAQVGLNKGEAHHSLKNALHLDHAVEARRREGLDTPDHLLAHMPPLKWAHILLTGEYLWPEDASA